LVLKEKILELATSENPEVARLSSLEKHLVLHMTLKHLISFAVPIERLLQKNLADDEFLILENDKAPIEVKKQPLVFVLDNIRSAFNVGSLFRTAECLGAEAIHLCGYTPTPQQLKVAKTAMGTQDYLTWEEHLRTEDCLQILKAKGYRLIGLETTTHALPIYEDFALTPTAFIVGNERFGLEADILKLLDEVRIIPLQGRKNSLNVGVTAAVAGFEWMRQWQTKK
jgi:tRNA G18 (ribose-2'-O)-methylase SpoU